MSPEELLRRKQPSEALPKITATTVSHYQYQGSGAGVGGGGGGGPTTTASHLFFRDSVTSMGDPPNRSTSFTVGSVSASPMAARTMVMPSHDATTHAKNGYPGGIGSATNLGIPQPPPPHVTGGAATKPSHSPRLSSFVTVHVQPSLDEEHPAAHRGSFFLTAANTPGTRGTGAGANVANPLYQDNGFFSLMHAGPQVHH